MQSFFFILINVMPLAFIVGMYLWVVLGQPTRSPSKQAKIDDMSKTARKTAYVYKRGHASASPEQAKSIQAEIDEYRERVEAIEDELWREAHMDWVRYSERNLADSIALFEQQERDRQRDAVLGPQDPLAKAA